MSQPVDRRKFLAVAGAAGAGLLLPQGLAGNSGLARSAAPRRRPLIASVPRHLEQAMRGRVFERGAPGYAAAARIYNERFDGVMPRAVGRPVNGRDVRGAVRWGVAHGVPMRPRSGGHSYEGYSTLASGVVLDLRRLSSISVDRHARTATIGAGAQLIDVYTKLAARGATIPSGSCPSVGIAGVTLGGGMGLAGRAHGLTLDHLLAAQIVTADGELRTVEAHSDPDLLWALRGGGGGNFGIVTQFTFRIVPLPSSASFFIVDWPFSSASEVIANWLQWAPHARDELTSILHLEAGGATAVRVTGQFLGPESKLGGLLGPLRSIPGASVSTGQRGYAALQLLWAGCAHTSLAACHTVGTSPGGMLARASFQAKSDYIRTSLPSHARQILLNAIQSRAGQPGSGAILFDSYGGQINRVHPSDTAFVHRQELCAVQYLSYGGGGQWLRSVHSAMRPYVSGQAYQNYIDREQPNWQHAYYGSNYSRLKAVRHAVDPDHFFNFPQAIGR